MITENCRGGCSRSSQDSLLLTVPKALSTNMGKESISTSALTVRNSLQEDFRLKERALLTEFKAVGTRVVSRIHDWVSGSVLEKAIRPGDNVTLYCDCKISTGVYIVWYRNCSHENQPALVLKLQINSRQIKERNEVDIMNPIPRFHFVSNESSDSYDLLIENTTDSDEGLYYCGTEEPKLEDKNCITTKWIYTYGNITTRIIFTEEPQVEQRLERSCQTTLDQDEDVWYAALEIRQLILKLDQPVINTSLCNWLFYFLIGRPQAVPVGRNTSSITTLNTEALQGCVLSPLLFALLTHDCTPSHSSNLYCGVVFCSHDLVSGSVLEKTIKPGDNVTLYCDCKTSTGVYIVWYRNCSHENQPALVLKLIDKTQIEDAFSRNPIPHFHFVKNESSDSYDLLIENITDSDEGLYYCGTEELKVEDNKYITTKWVYTYGNITTRIIFTEEPQVDQQRLERSRQTTLDQDEDVCYAALEIRQVSQRPKKKKAQSSDFSTRIKHKCIKHNILLSFAAPLVIGVISCCHDLTSGSVLEVTIRPGDNVTLYCDCKISTGVYVVWYRNCSHENQPTLVLKVKGSFRRESSNTLRFQFVKNESSDSYDLLIENITESDEGLYYCGTEEPKLEDNKCITPKPVYRYSNVTTRIVFNSSAPIEPHQSTPQDCAVCWMLLFSLCPAFAFLSSLLSSLLVYHLCQRTANEPVADEKRPETRGNEGNQYRTVQDYAIDFCTKAHLSDWNEPARCSAFLRGLGEYLKDELVSYEVPSSFDDLVKLTTRIDRRIQARRRQ
ncbi:hypothetical protein L3Q82_005395 [Scortum barcoo]|uniref:Uncharacterized protein n=1 Tax=Scortum barcoo TaxID=214431 RepID=A0ACB8V9X2_9TELE|nr:hypothetical protein L3Q82_005395 [Scortum barcoo]